MNLLNDLLHALLIPLAGWDVRFFGYEATLPVTPLLLIALFVVADRLLAYTFQRIQAAGVGRGPREDAWEERPAPVPVVKS